MRASRAQVLRFRVHAQQLDARRARQDVSILDLGVQDTGNEGAGWALALRRSSLDEGDLLHAWTIRGAPHVYRRAEAAQVAAAVAPFSDADAGKRIFDAAAKLRKAGIGILDGLDHVAEEMRDYARTPRTKGEMSAELTRRLDEPYLRWCNPCQATHSYEQTFRLSALRGGLELDAGTSPPVLRRIKGWRGPAKQVPPHLDVVRGVLRFLGPTTPKLVAGYIDTTVSEVKKVWPDDVVPVTVGGVDLELLAADERALADPPVAEGSLLLGAFDLFLQGRDRELVLPDAAARKDLWRMIGRPGAVLDGHEVVGTWRPRSKGDRLKLALTIWSGADRPAGLEQQAERLADFRGQTFDGFVEA